MLTKFSINQLSNGVISLNGYSLDHSYLKDKNNLYTGGILNPYRYSLTDLATNKSLYKNSPIANDDTFKIKSGESLLVYRLQENAISSNDMDIDSSKSQLIYSLHENGKLGVANIYAGGTFFYSPITSQPGTDIIIYKVTDETGLSDTGKITINIVPDRFNLTAVDDTFQIEFGKTLDIISWEDNSIRSNDEYLDSSYFSLRFSLYQDGLKGAANITNYGNFTYSPHFGQIGNDTVKYKLEDDTGNFDIGTITVEILTNKNVLWGTTSSDSIELPASGGWASAGLGNDTVNGGVLADLIYGNKGLDVLHGGLGNDVLYGGQNEYVISGGVGDSSDALEPLDGVETLLGGGGDDIVYGNKGPDSLEGGIGGDNLYGGQDNDTLIGGWGNDTLAGNQGDDLLIGGDGEDVFVVSSSGADFVQDFHVFHDKLSVEWSNHYLTMSYDARTYGDAKIVNAAGTSSYVIFNDVPYSAFYSYGEYV